MKLRDRKTLRAWIRSKQNWPLNQIRRFRRARTVSALRGETGFAIEVLYNRRKPSEFSELCDLYGSDKGSVSLDGHPYSWPAHSYADFYSLVFSHCRNQVRAVFECGIGTNNPNIPSSMGESGVPGASLRAFRDYFPNAEIFGADIDVDILFSENRITTFHLDQTNPVSVRRVWSQIEDEVDLIVDDGLHEFFAGITLFENSIEYLSRSGIYVIEDVDTSDLPRYQEYFDSTPYYMHIVLLHREHLELGNNCLITVRKQG